MAVNHGAGEEPEDELLPCGQSLMELWEDPAGPRVPPAGPARTTTTSDGTTGRVLG